MKTPPHVPAEVVEYLDGIFPDRCPDPFMAERDVWIAVGAVRVVRKLKQLVQDQAAHALLRSTDT